MPSGEGVVRVQRTGPRATVEWDRPPLNVFDVALLRAVGEALRSEPVRSAHVVVLRGAGQRWSAGFAVEDHLPDRVRPMFRAFRDVLAALGELAVPSIGEVDGPCLGGALELLAGCDLAVAGTGATFGQPEVRLGVFPPLSAATGARELGWKRAADLLFSGESWSAADARAFGLVSRVAAAPSARGDVDRLADRIGGYRREALVLLKRAMHQAGGPRWTGLDLTEQVYLDELLSLPAADEGLKAFLEKRAPAWPPPVP